MNQKESRVPVFRFAVISDSHFTESDHQAQPYYPSNRLFNKRNERVIEILNHLPLDFIIHLGDIPHLAPGMATYPKAVAAAREVYKDLKAPMYITPGNHDIGDKQKSRVPAPVVSKATHEMFQRNWGPLYSCFSRRDCAFILFDSPVINSGASREKDQSAWLVEQLEKFSKENKRIFLCTHYPLFIDTEDEQEHYDNIGQPARSTLLELIDRYQVNTVFTGHAHNFFYNRRNGTDFYSLPSTGFTRPEYSELFFIESALEFGRNDFAKLGFFVISVFEDDYVIDLVRLHDLEGNLAAASPTASYLSGDSLGGDPIPLGFSLRNSWSAQIEIPCSDLDEFFRKTARNDHGLLALLDLRAKHIRLPYSDLLSPRSRERLAHLAHLGFRFTIFSVDSPDEGQVELIRSLGNAVETWEVNIEWDDLPTVVEALKEHRSKLDCRIILSKILTLAEQTTRKYHYFSHFVFSGFLPDEIPLLREQPHRPDQAGLVDGYCFSVVSEEEDIWGQVDQCARVAAEDNIRIIINVQMKRDAEGVWYDNEAAIANRVTESWVASMISDRVQLYLDTFIDHDRGYMPRRALLDRRYNPTKSYYVLKNLTRLGLYFRDTSLRIRKLSSQPGIKAFALETDHKGLLLLMFAEPTDDVRLTMPDSLCRLTEVINLEDGAELETVNQRPSTTAAEFHLRLKEQQCMPLAVKYETHDIG